MSSIIKVLLSSVLLVGAVLAKVNVGTRYNGDYSPSKRVSGAFVWSKDAFTNEDCRSENQPVVEYYYLNGMQYLFFSQRVTWEEARLVCPNYNAKLAVLDNMEKATAIAEAIAESNIVMEDTWLGGRRLDFVWTWVDMEDHSWRATEIPSDSDLEGYPPWSREPFRPTKECLAIDRRSHAYPNFIDLDCRIQRPFICEKLPEDSVKSPVPSKWVQVHKSTFTLYHARVTWREAATFCRSQGSRLAIIRNPSTIDILINSMTKTRPDFEYAWIGAHYSYGQWVWMASGALLSPITEDNGYPPWRFGRPERNEGCLLLDRHIDGSANFIEIACDRKRDFICEEYPEEESDDWLNEPVKFTHDNSTYIIYPMDKTWQESKHFCIERGSILAYVNNINTTNLIIEAMGDHPKEISHVWLGGVMDSKTDKWQWAHNGEMIATNRDRTGFPPWTQVDSRIDFNAANSTCLNMDRSDHVVPHLYGLDCESKQPFVCKITCDIPPPARNGNWVCRDTPKGRDCSLACDEDYIMMGISNVSCSHHGGWTSTQNWLEFPTCYDPKEYAHQMAKTFSSDIQKSVGYYMILDHTDRRMRALSLLFAERIQNAFPINHNLRMGMMSEVTDPPVHIPFNQTDTCAILAAIRKMQNNVAKMNTRDIDGSLVYKDLRIYNGRKTLIIAIIDAQRGVNYTDALIQLKRAGHHIAVIGVQDDWEFLMPLATAGYNHRANMFLLSPVELSKVIIELHKIKRKDTKCSQSKPTNNHDEMYWKDPGDVLEYQNVKQHQTIPPIQYPEMKYSTEPLEFAEETSNAASNETFDSADIKRILNMPNLRMFPDEEFSPSTGQIRRKPNLQALSTTSKNSVSSQAVQGLPATKPELTSIMTDHANETIARSVIRVPPTNTSTGSTQTSLRAGNSKFEAPKSASISEMEPGLPFAPVFSLPVTAAPGIQVQPRVTVESAEENLDTEIEDVTETSQ